MPRICCSLSCNQTEALFAFTGAAKATAKFPVDFAGQTDIELTERN